MMIRNSSFVILDTDASLSGSENELMVDSPAPECEAKTKNDASTESSYIIGEFPNVDESQSSAELLELPLDVSEIADAEPKDSPTEQNETLCGDGTLPDPQEENTPPPTEDTESQTEVCEPNPESPFSTVIYQSMGVFHKAYELFQHLDNISKSITLIALLIGVLIPGTAIIGHSSKNSTHGIDQVDFGTQKSDIVAADLAKCKMSINWAQEKSQQYKTQVEKLNAKYKDSQQSLGECRWSLADTQSELSNAKKKVEKLEESYEKLQQKVIDLQNKIIQHQSESQSESLPFFQRAFDTIFGWKDFAKSRKHRNRKHK